MERAQKATYGEGLDERYLQKFMWTWKPHYYSPNLSFYNSPTHLVCSLQQACTPSTKNAAQTLCQITRTCSPPQARTARQNLPTALALTSAPKNSGRTVSPSSAGAWNVIARFNRLRRDTASGCVPTIYENACIPVCALPNINAWISCVPS